jgi:hypothetical protein
MWGFSLVSDGGYKLYVKREVGRGKKSQMAPLFGLCPNLENKEVGRSVSEGHGEEETAYSERAIPRARAQRHAISADSQAAHSVLMTSEDAYSFAFESVPDVARPVIVTAKEDASRD